MKKSHGNTKYTIVVAGPSRTLKRIGDYVEPVNVLFSPFKDHIIIKNVGLFDKLLISHDDDFFSVPNITIPVISVGKFTKIDIIESEESINVVLTKVDYKDNHLIYTFDIVESERVQKLNFKEEVIDW